MARQDEKQRTVRRARDAAVRAAMNHEWQQAIELNQQILELGEEPQTYNRLAKAYYELGKYPEAMDAFQQTLRLNPTNTIARRNIARLDSMMSHAEPLPGARTRDMVDLRVFITEAGRTAVTVLQEVQPSAVIDLLAPGERVDLLIEGSQVFVNDSSGNRIGMVEPRIGQRIADLMNGGNQYMAAVVQTDSRQVRIIIRETFQHPSQRNRTSFPGRLMPGTMHDYLPMRYDYDYENEDALDDELSDDAEIMPTDGEENEEEIGLEEIEKNINDDEETED